jgi:hypothetical protein
MQILAIAALEIVDDIFRGNIDPPNVRYGLMHSKQIAQFEQAHGFFIEPTIQVWLRHDHALSGLISYGNVTPVADLIYALGQTLVPLLVAVWIFRKHRSHFPLVRNITILSTLLAVVGYELFPTAPPRLTPGLIFQHHAFHFQDTVQHVIGDGKLDGIPIGYNAYSAMPSLHMVWALIVATSVILLAHNLIARLMASLYPFVMLFTVVVTANHYVLDAAAAVVVVVLASVIALALEPLRVGVPQAFLSVLQVLRTAHPVIHQPDSSASTVGELPSVVDLGDRESA